MNLQQVGFSLATIKRQVLFGCALGILALYSASPPAKVFANNYVFDVLYFGDSNATLVPGSDDPDTTTLIAGDTFQWSITAQAGAYWNVLSDGNFFPLMAFAADPSADRTGDYTLQLLNDGLEVFQESDSNVVTSFVHVGTNSISLTAGLIFDEMRLDYSLTESLDDVTFLPVDTTLYGLLPIFGAPEFTAPGSIVYVVPEPTTGLLLAVSLAAWGWRRR